MDKFIGKKLDGRYLIQTLLGSGGMANVYKAGDLKEQRIVAVKILREECMSNEELVRRFKNESKAISVLNHPNIVKVYDVSVSEKLQYIVMEYIDGITLKDYMEYRKQPLTYKETLHFVSQTLLALQHAHAKGIVHRDIKPQNIMMLANGTIKVMDFGIARFSRSENQTMTDKAIGSVHYISPEQAKGDVTDSKADLYSVGVMMYEMLCGKLPFEGESPVGVAIKQISDAATPLRTMNPAVPEGLEAITEKAMAKEPRERYQSAAAMLTDIAAFKRNPSIKFEYQYLGDTSPTRYMDKVVGKQTSPRSNAAASARPGTRRPAQRSNSSRRNSNKFDWKKNMLPILGGTAAAFGVAALLICFILFQRSSLFKTAIDVSLPNFVGKTMSEIKAMEDYHNFTIEFKEEYNTDKDIVEGVAYDQTPKPPKNVKQGAHVVVRISKGVEKISLPNVVGLEKAAAITELKNAGFSVMVKQLQDETVPVGQVVKLMAADGTDVKSGDLIPATTTIVVYVSVEVRETEVLVPMIVGLSKEDAMIALRARNLSFGTITTVDNEAPAGTIIVQSPEPDTKVKVQSSVHVQISSGHQHSYAEEILTPATCIAPGKKKLTCSCGDTREEEIPINPEAHQFQENVEKCINGHDVKNPNYKPPAGGGGGGPVVPVP